jgi:hypothetical protein
MTTTANKRPFTKSNEPDIRSSLSCSIYTLCDPELRSVFDEFSLDIVDFSSTRICFGWSTSDLSIFLAIETLIVYIPYLDAVVSKVFGYPIEIVFQPSLD